MLAGLSLAVALPAVGAPGAHGAEEPPPQRRGGPPLQLRARPSGQGATTPSEGIAGLKAPPKVERRTRVTTKLTPTAPDGTARSGLAMLRAGKPRAAIASLEANLALAPDSQPIQMALGRAYGRIGRCDRAMGYLDATRDAPGFDAIAAMAGALCAGRLGLLEEALAYEERGLSVEPDDVRLLTTYALDLARAGDAGGSEAAVDALVVAHPKRDASAFARASLALQEGDLDALDVELALWERADRDTDEVSRLRAQAALDLDDPRSALREIDAMQRLRHGPNVRQLRAEAWRRLGAPGSALGELDGPRNGVLEGPDVDAVRVRALVDMGQLDEAAALLSLNGGDDVSRREPDMLASAWYLARARGDAGAQARYAAAWRSAEPSRLRTLELYVPLDARVAPTPVSP